MEKFSERQLEIIGAAGQRIDTYGLQNLTIKSLAFDLKLSEPALYRHFDNKNAILSALLATFYQEMQIRLSMIPNDSNCAAGSILKAIFMSQLEAFSRKPAVLSILFSENSFFYDNKLKNQVLDIMELMQKHVLENLTLGQQNNQYTQQIDKNTLLTIMQGTIRMCVLKWRLTKNKSNLLTDGTAVLEALLLMIEKKQ